MKPPIHVLIVCGGTGGHLAPGIAVGEGLHKRGNRAILLISEKEVDSRLIRKYSGMQFEPIPAAPFVMNPVGFARFLWKQSHGVIRALRIIRRERPDLVMAFGGFTSMGVVVAARILGVAVVLHEANRKVGRAVRLLRKSARRVFLPPGIRLRGVQPKLIRHHGFPVRDEIRRIPREVARKRLGLPQTDSGKWLVILGGSQGASILNDWVSRNFESLAAEGINVYCLTGLGKGSRGTLQALSVTGQPVNAVFAPFSDEMGWVISAADLVISRAGAGTIAELIRCQRPSILIPYPYAADDHQMANAQFLERQGGSILVKEANLASLKDEVFDAIFNDWLLDRMRKNLARLGEIDSRDRIVDELEQLAERVRREPHERSRPRRSRTRREVSLR